MIKFRSLASAVFAVAALGFALSTVSTPARALDANSGTPAQRAACTADAMNFCMSGWHGKTGIPGIVECLKHDDRVSQQCKNAMAKSK